jgi:hypothetical protein
MRPEPGKGFISEEGPYFFENELFLWTIGEWMFGDGN